MKVIEPLSKNIKPDLDPSAGKKTHLAAVPVTHSPAPPLPGVLPQNAAPHAEPLTNEDKDTRWTYAPYLFVFGALPGVFYYVLYSFVATHIPGSVCAQIIASDCSHTLLTGVLTAAALFLAGGVIGSLMLRKNFLLPFFIGGLGVALFTFLEFAMLANRYLLPALSWLYTQHILNEWVIPAALGGIFVALASAATFYLQKKTKVLIGAAAVVASALLIVFLPNASANFAAQQTQAAVKDRHEELITLMQKSDVPLYTPKNYSGPLTVTSFTTSIGNQYFEPGYEVIYNFTNPYHAQLGAARIYIHKAAATGFNPPTTCGENALPHVSSGPVVATFVPCSLFITTAKGRQVYGYVPSWKFGQLHIKEGSAEASAVPPDTYYVHINDIVLSFNGPTANGREDTVETKTPLTPAVIEQFVDSLEPLQGNDLVQFAHSYLKNQ